MIKHFLFEQLRANFLLSFHNNSLKRKFFLFHVDYIYIYIIGHHIYPLPNFLFLLNINHLVVQIQSIITLYFPTRL